LGCDTGINRRWATSTCRLTLFRKPYKSSKVKYNRVRTRRGSSKKKGSKASSMKSSA